VHRCVCRTCSRFVCPDPTNQGQYIHKAPEPGERRPNEPWMVVWGPVFDGLSRKERRVRVGAYVSLWLQTGRFCVRGGIPHLSLWHFHKRSGFDRC
jgi:hypothetical protein